MRSGGGGTRNCSGGDNDVRFGWWGDGSVDSWYVFMGCVFVFGCLAGSLAVQEAAGRKEGGREVVRLVLSPCFASRCINVGCRYLGRGRGERKNVGFNLSGSEGLFVDGGGGEDSGCCRR